MSSKVYDFDQVTDRKNTHSFKWDNVTYPPNLDVLPMPVADMDFVVADEILAAIDKITSHGILGYSIVPDSLKLLAQKKIERDYSWSTSIDSQVWIPGIVPGITAACAALTNENEGIITAVPVYHPFHLVAGWVNCPLITFEMIKEGDRWTFDFADFERGLQKGPKVFLLCNPHNPGGTVFNETEIFRIVDLCAKYNVTIVSDEIHADLRLHAQSKHISIGRFEKQSIISFFATSKAFNTAGLGGAVAVILDAALRDKFTKASAGFFSMLSRHSIEVMLATYAYGEEWLAQLLPYLKTNHDLLLEYVRATPGLTMQPLEATYLAWIEYDEVLLGDFQKKCWDAGLHVLRGEQFKGRNFIRLNFACPKSLMEEAIKRMKSITNG
ncbi:MalY/PatB family protein [Aquirufa sp. A-Brett2-W8]